MVETCRWPKASYSVSSMACVSTFRREACSRSTSTLTCKPPDCWSEATSESAGLLRNTVSSFGAHSDSSSTSASVSVY